MTSRYAEIEVRPVRRIEYIEQQISELTVGEFSELRDWLLEQDWKSWDTQIESDVHAEKLEKILAEAQADYAAGRTRPLRDET